MRRRACRILIAVVAMAASAAGADVIQLVDGTTLSGSVRRSEDGRWIVSIAGRPVFVAAADVRSITLSPLPSSTTQQADERLQSLRRAVESLADLNQIISRYESFLVKVKEPAAAEPARRELADYRALSAARAIRVGDRWLTPAQVNARLAAGPPPIETARLALKENRLDDARAALGAAASLMPDDPGLTYLYSLLHFQENDLPAAHAELDTLLVLLPDHAPTLNNLAVVQWRQRQYLASLSSYDSALASVPQSEVVLANVAAALATLPIPFQSTPMFQQLSDHYDRQERLLEADMASHGMRRFGDRWLPSEQVAQLQAQENEVQKELDQIADHFDHLRQQIEQLDHRRAGLLADRQRILGPEPTAFDLGYSGEAALSSPLSSDLTEDERQDALQRRLLVQKLDALTDQAKLLQAKLIVPGADHRQRLIGVEGTPFVDPAAPPGVPTTNPSMTSN